MDGAGWFQFLVSAAFNVAALYFAFHQHRLHTRSISPASAYRRDPWLKRYWPMVVMACLVVLVWVPFVYARLWPAQVVGQRYIVGYGTEQLACAANVNTAKMADLADKFQFAVACGFQDVTVDRDVNTKMTITNLFNIAGGTMQAAAPWSPAMMDAYRQMQQSEMKARNLPSGSQPPNVQTSQWYVVVVLPKGSNPKLISRLADVAPMGGQVLFP